jgi:hypothetical protein
MSKPHTSRITKWKLYYASLLASQTPCYHYWHHRPHVTREAQGFTVIIRKWIYFSIFLSAHLIHISPMLYKKSLYFWKMLFPSKHHQCCYVYKEQNNSFKFHCTPQVIVFLLGIFRRAPRPSDTRGRLCTTQIALFWPKLLPALFLRSLDNPALLKSWKKH